MTEPEPTPPQETPVPPSDHAPKGAALHPALTGLAGMVVGSILLGKKAGLLAGILGAGAKVLLEQRAKASPQAPILPDPPASHLESSATEVPLASPALAPEPMHLQEAPTTEDLDSTLDEAISHKEEFQNYGQHLDFQPPQDAPGDIPPVADFTPEAPAEAFVNWPESAVDPANVGQTAFHEFVANMFQEAAQASAPTAPAILTQTNPDTLPVWSASEFISDPPEAPTPPTEAPSSLLDAFSAQPTGDQSPPPSAEPAELTPEDIWRLAASEGFTINPLEPPLNDHPEPQRELPAAPLLPEETEVIHVLDAIPAQVFPSLSEAPSPIPLSSDIPHQEEPFSPPSAAAVAIRPPGMAPFVELFGLAAAAPAPAPVPPMPVATAAYKRTPLLTPAEEAELSASPVKQMAEEPPLAAEIPVPSLRFSPPTSAPTESPPKSGGKTLAILTLLAALAGGCYAKRDLLLATLHDWTHTPPRPTAPDRTKSPPAPIPAPPETVPAGVAPAPDATIPAPAIPVVTPPPAVPEPMPPPVEVRPAAPDAPDPSVPTLPLVPPEPTDPVSPPPKELVGQRKAEDAIRAFLGFTKVEDIISSALNRQRLAPAIQKYYAGNPLTPTSFTDLVLDSSASNETNVQAFLFRVRTQERPAGFPICVEQTGEGFKIEWEAFIQCRDRTASNFWKSTASEPKTLYVILKRSHYFGEDMENLEDFECFRVNSPNPDEEPVYAFARKDSVFSRKYRNQLTWDASYFAVAVFTHVKNSKGLDHQEIVNIERFNWRSGGK